MRYAIFVVMLLAFVFTLTVFSSAQTKNCGNCTTADRSVCTVKSAAQCSPADRAKCDAKLAANCPIKNCPDCPSKQAMKSSSSGAKNQKSAVKGASVVRALETHPMQNTGKKTRQSVN